MSNLQVLTKKVNFIILQKCTQSCVFLSKEQYYMHNVNFNLNLTYKQISSAKGGYLTPAFDYSKPKGSMPNLTCPLLAFNCTLSD